MRLVMNSSSLPVAPASYEQPLAFLPPTHLRGEELVLLLRRNGISCRPLGRGCGTIMPDLSNCEILFLAVPHGTCVKAHRYLRLFGATVVELSDNQGATG